MLNFHFVFTAMTSPLTRHIAYIIDLNTAGNVQALHVAALQSITLGNLIFH